MRKPKKYKYDKSSVELSNAKLTIKEVLLRVLRYFLGSVTLAVFYYVIFALLISTDTERRLQKENRMFKEVYPGMEYKEQVVRDVISQLQLRDNDIYSQVFHSKAPTVEHMSLMNSLFSNDTIPDTDIVLYSEKKLEIVDSVALKIENNFKEIYALLDSTVLDYPMALPIKDVSYAQVGASLGNKLNPFYKVDTFHDGIDLISPAGTPVYAAAAGTVIEVKRARKGKGNTVVIQHDGGYITKYSHLADIEVSRGRKVKRGALIGNVGSTGNTYAPHLHYEVWKDTLALDPINFFFGSITPGEYTNMVLMSASTRQSLD
jgi:murein DD-endopeptidase MepM/ murein hydrolase activator NlpD